MGLRRLRFLSWTPQGRGSRFYWETPALSSTQPGSPDMLLSQALPRLKEGEREASSVLWYPARRPILL